MCCPSVIENESVPSNCWARLMQPFHWMTRGAAILPHHLLCYGAVKKQMLENFAAQIDCITSF